MATISTEIGQFSIIFIAVAIDFAASLFELKV